MRERGREKDGGRRRERSWRGGEEQREKEGGGLGEAGVRVRGRRESCFLSHPLVKYGTYCAWSEASCTVT